MKRFTKPLSLLLAFLIMLSSVMVISAVNIFAAGTLTYSFSSTKAGYAQGKISLSGLSGDYDLYWADNTKALTGYRKIATVSGSGSFDMPKYTAIPDAATKLIAVKSGSSTLTVSGAAAVYSIPASKQFNSKLLYTFGSISDPQLANDSYGSGSYPHDETHLKKALETLATRDVDFTVLSGDVVNDQNGAQTYAAEFERYQRILADSSYAAPIYEANGNHDVATYWDKNGNYYNNNAPFIKATGLNGDKSTINAGKPYFEVTEPVTGDHFIFMALEGGFYTNKGTQFSKAQLDWLEGLLKKYKNDGKNIFIIEHANVGGWGSGDKLTTPYYYDLALVKSNSDVSRFVKLMETYKDCVIITGHTHLQLEAKDSWVGQYNYSDNNGTSAVMIHNSAIGGVRKLVNGKVDRSAQLGLSEGYIVEVYEDGILFNGTNMYYNEMIPQCCYIIPMTTSEQEVVTTPTEPTTKATEPAKTEATEPKVTTVATKPTVTEPKETTKATEPVVIPTTVVTIPTEPTGTTEVTVPEVDELAPVVIVEKLSNGNIKASAYPADGNYDCQYQFAINGAVYQKYSDKSTFTFSVPYDSEYVVSVLLKYSEGDAHDASVAFEVVNGEAVLPEMPDVPTKPAQTEPTETTIQGEPSESTTSDIITTTVTQATTATVPDDIPFYGDADLNGKVNVKDATQVQKYTAKMLTLEGIAFTQADVTGDGKVNIKDATAIQKYVAKIIAVFPVEEASLVTVSAGTTAKQDLETYYTYSSYDQYMALKRANLDSATQTVITKCQNALYDIVGYKPGETKSITVYFENSKNWSTVKIYAWGTGGKNAEWSGVAMTKQSNGKYSYTFNYSDYQNIIFNDGSSQTVDISHPGTDGLVYKISGESGGKFTVTC